MNSKVLKRLMTILITLEAHPRGLSAVELSKITGYPEGLILKDLNDILYYTEMAEHFAIYPDEEADLPGQEYEFNEPIDAPVDYKIVNPEVRWVVSVEAGPYPALSLTVRETMAMLWLFKDISPPVKLNEFCNSLIASILSENEVAVAKEMANNLLARGGVDLRESSYLDMLREAVLNEQKVRMVYYAKGINQVVDWLLWPLGLVFHTGNGIWYLVAIKEETGETVVCHLERIHSLNTLDRVFSYPEDFSMREYLNMRWGMDFSPPETIRVRFYDEANVVAKVKEEFKARGLTGLVELPDGSLEYRGEILGIRNFAKWVLSFGSSAEVLEPVWLREEMIEQALNWQRIYNAV